jgi:hypothetical protein
MIPQKLALGLTRGLGLPIFGKDHAQINSQGGIMLRANVMPV